MARPFLFLLASLLPTAAWAASPAAPAKPAHAPPDPAGVEFFEARIRPVLAERCYSCHSSRAEKVKGKLWLDTRAGLFKGGDSGAPAVVPGKPDQSKLIVAIRYTDEDLQMPPKGERLPANVVADFEAWVRGGAPDPRDEGPAAPPAVAAGNGAAGATSHLDIAAAKNQWAFRVPTMPAVPPVADPVLAGWCKSPVDAFVAARLSSKGLRPAAPADKRTLLRRVTFDLIGLPPTPAELAAFEADLSPDAFARVVDRLLASPRYGERWGRFWLDVARYADTKGYVFEEERRYAFAYAYRDWVIRAFNEDLPYDQFLLQQIAADRLPAGTDARPLAAMGFLTLGRRFLNNQPDIIDDRIDVIFRGTQGLTVGCARCHDHKYDPIPTRDYYSLYGIFASSDEPKKLPLLDPSGRGARTPEATDYERQNAALEAELAKLRATLHAKKVASFRAPPRIAEDLLSGAELARVGDADAPAAIAAMAQKKAASGATQAMAYLLRRYRASLRGAPANANSHAPGGGAVNEAIFGPWRAFVALPPADFAARAPAVAKRLAADPRTPGPLARAFAPPFATPPASLKEVANRYAAVLSAAYQRHTLPTAEQAVFRRLLALADLPFDVPLADADSTFDRDDAAKLRAVRKKIDALTATHPGSPPRAHVLEDLPRPVTPHVFLRGNPGNTGPEVPRAFLSVLSPAQRQPFRQGSGRLELARAIASKDNPLTARVMVNRVWQHHFGVGLVRTPGDFGSRGGDPSHPELLDYLARRFMDEGWSVKNLHRMILLSATYQQASDADEAVEARAKLADADDRLLWRQNRQRLDFESLRDSLLAEGGRLDARMFGRSSELFSTRRSVYVFIDRQNLPGLFRTFDFASPDATSPQRFSTTVPQQALFLMNSPFAVEQAKSLAARPEVAGEKEPARRVEALYRLLYCRPPSAEETKLGLDYVAAETAAKPRGALSAWEKYAQVLLESNEFVFVD